MNDESTEWVFRRPDPSGWLSDFGISQESMHLLGIGLIVGVILTLVIYLVLGFLARMRARKRSIIFIPGEQGDFFIMPRAVRDFVVNSLEEFRDVSIRHVYVYGKGRGYTVRIDVELVPGTAFATTKDEMTSKVLADLEEMMGITAALRVKLNLLGYDANRRPVKQS